MDNAVMRCIQVEISYKAKHVPGINNFIAKALFMGCILQACPLYKQVRAKMSGICLAACGPVHEDLIEQLVSEDMGSIQDKMVEVVHVLWHLGEPDGKKSSVAP